MFKLTENYGGPDRVRYFKTFEAAIATLPSSTFYREDAHPIDSAHLPDRIDGMKGVDVNSDENFFLIRGIPYPESERDDYDLYHCEISIINIDFEPTGRSFYEVCYHSGYYDEIICGKTPWAINAGYFNSVDECKAAFTEDPRVKAWETKCGIGDYYSGRYLAYRQCHLSE